MPTSPQGRRQKWEYIAERYPALTRVINAVAALLCAAVAAAGWVLGDTGMVLFGGVAGLVLAVGVVWPKFSALDFLLLR